MKRSEVKEIVDFINHAIYSNETMNLTDGEVLDLIADKLKQLNN